MKPAIIAENLSVEFERGLSPALNKVDLSIPQGGFVGIVGPNGSGKSTLLRVVTGLLRPSQGKIEIFGVDVAKGYREVLGRVGYVPDQIAVYPFLSGREFLELFWETGGGDPKLSHANADEILRDIGLEQVGRRSVGTYSNGMLRRLMIGQALIHHPDVLVLDEPFNGLDVPGMRYLRFKLREYNARGKTIIVSSHDLAQIDEFCNMVCILKKGRVLRFDPIEQVRATLQSKNVRIRFKIRFENASEELRKFLKTLPYDLEISDEPVVLLAIRGIPGEFDAVLKSLAESPVDVLSIEPTRPLLEEAVYSTLEGEEP